MKRIAAGLLAVGSCVALTGCYAKEAKDGLQEVAQASSAQCVAERDVLEKAIEAYSILENKIPTTEIEMVPLYLRVESLYMDIGPNGTVVAAPGSGCN